MSAFKLKLQMMCGEEIAMGPGKADLLEMIRTHGSISAAARAMGMSYRRAWLLVDAMNRCWAEPLVETSPGHAHGTGARLSSMGEDVLARYRALLARLDNDLDGRSAVTLGELMRIEPLKRQAERRAERAEAP